jgi:hypothetical protein
MMDLLKVLQDKEALANKVKAEVPGALDFLATAIAKECGAVPEEPVAVVLFKANTAEGSTMMARVHRVDEFGELGEELGTIDVPAAMRAVPNESITKFIPF